MKKLIPAVLAMLLLVTLSGWFHTRPQPAPPRVDFSADAAALCAEMAAQPEETRLLQEKLTQWYNLNLRLDTPDPDFSQAYDTVLCFSNGAMAILEIPSLAVTVPIYHGTGPESLEKGVGHLPLSAFPSGEGWNHTVLMGAAFLPEGTLFSDLGTLREGDVFHIHVMDRTLTYQVQLVQSGTPWRSSSFAIVPGQSLCTLVTPAAAQNPCLVQGLRVAEP